MRAVAKCYGLFLTALAVVAAASVASVFLAIIYDVLLRTVRLQPPIWTSPLSEYVLLYATTLSAPWLMRQKGHVFITTFIDMLPVVIRRIVNKVIYLVGTLVCLLLAYVSLEVLLSSHGMEIRTFAIPRWTVFVTMPPAFLLLAIEFARFLIGVDSLYRGGTQNESL